MIVHTFWVELSEKSNEAKDWGIVSPSSDYYISFKEIEPGSDREMNLLHDHCIIHYFREMPSPERLRDMIQYLLGGEEQYVEWLDDLRFYVVGNLVNNTVLSCAVACGDDLVEVAKKTFIPSARKVTKEEGKELFNKRCWDVMGISGDDFLRLWNNGGLNPSDDNVAAVLMYLPFVKDE